MATTFQARSTVDIKILSDLSLLRNEARLVANYSVDIELDLNDAFSSVVLHGVPIPDPDEGDEANLEHTENSSYDAQLFAAMHGIKNGNWASARNDGHESTPATLQDQMLVVVRRCLYENGYPETGTANSEGTGTNADAGKGNVIDTGLLGTWINARFADLSAEQAGTDSTNTGTGGSYSISHPFGKMVFQTVHLNEIFARAMNANRYREVDSFDPNNPAYQIDFEDADICCIKCILYNTDETSQTSFLLNMHHLDTV